MAVTSATPSIELEGKAECASEVTETATQSLDMHEGKEESTTEVVDDHPATVDDDDHGYDEEALQAEEGVGEYVTGTKLAVVITALCFSVFLIALDNAIIATAIPKITADFHSLPDVGWYGSAYLLTTSAMQLPFGKLYSMLSIKYVYLAAITMFEIGSLVCGVAQNSITLIVGRAIAGLGAAGILSGALLVLSRSVPLAKRPVYTGIVGSIYGIANVAGPLLGGVFTDKLTWRWCFFINLPIGSVTIIGIVFFFFDRNGTRIPKSEPLIRKIACFDPLGTLALIPGLICLLLAFQWGGTQFPWNNGRVIALFVVSGVLLISFVIIQLRSEENATIPVRIIKNRTIWSCLIFVFGIGAAFYIEIYYIPIWFQSVQGTSPVESGIRNLPLLLAVTIFSVTAGILVSKFGYYTPFLILSSVFIAIGAGLTSTWNLQTGSGKWIGYQIIFGTGVGFGMQQTLMAVQTVLKPADIPTGTAVMVFGQSLGGALFVGIGDTVFENSLAQALAKYAPGVQFQTVQNAGAGGLQQTFSSEVLPQVLLSYNTALMKVFLMATAMASITILGSAFCEWKSVKKMD